MVAFWKYAGQHGPKVVGVQINTSHIHVYSQDDITSINTDIDTHLIFAHLPLYNSTVSPT